MSTGGPIPSIDAEFNDYLMNISYPYLNAKDQPGPWGPYVEMQVATII